MLSFPIKPNRQKDPAKAGLWHGAKGTHASRTIMLADLSEVLAAVSSDGARTDYAAAIIDENVLGKATVATRRLTNQRLSELYALDPRVPIFRVLRRLWPMDTPGRPLLTMLCALARDPLLRSTAPFVLALPVGAELDRVRFRDTLRQAVGRRLNDAVLDQAARKCASSWTQSGHLAGRTRKIRRRVVLTPGPLAMAFWLGTTEGLTGRALLENRWSRVLDHQGATLMPVALKATQLGLIHVRAGGDIVEIDAWWLDPATCGRSHKTGTMRTEECRRPAGFRSRPRLSMTGKNGTQLEVIDFPGGRELGGDRWNALYYAIAANRAGPSHQDTGNIP